jgi:hypothetical protein
MGRRNLLREQVADFAADARPDRWGAPELDASTGYFAIALLSLAQTNSLAGYWFGASRPRQPTANQVVEFIRIRFPDPYRRPAALLYDMYGHGLVHQYTPRVVRIGTLPIRWLLARGVDRFAHLRLFSRDAAEQHFNKSFRTMRSNRAYLCVQVDLLYQDVVEVGSKLVRYRRQDPGVRSRITRSLRMRDTMGAFPGKPKSKWTPAERDALSWIRAGRPYLKSCQSFA